MSAQPFESRLRLLGQFPRKLRVLTQPALRLHKERPDMDEGEFTREALMAEQLTGDRVTER